MPAKPSPEEFLSACRRARVVPLSPYVDYSTPISCECEICGEGPFDKAWSTIRDGNKHWPCSKLAKRIDDFEKSEPIARELLAQESIEPVGPYRGFNHIFVGICQICGSETNSRPTSIQRGMQGCFACARKKGGRVKALRIYPKEEALRIFEDAGILVDPAVDYRGARFSMPGKCINCGLPTKTSLLDAKKGQGCRTCHRIDKDFKFDYFGPAKLYLVYSPVYRAYKIGIMEATSNRLTNHRQQKFSEVVQLKDFEFGFEALYVEQFTLTWLRNQGIESAVSNTNLPFYGSTETWPEGAIDIDSVWAKVEELTLARDWPIPRKFEEGTATKKPRLGCSVIEEGVPCEKPHASRMMCQSHYTRFMKYGDPLHSEKVVKYAVDERCPVIDDGVVCGQQIAVKGYCQKHYLRFRKWGDATVNKNKDRVRNICSLEGCERLVTSNGICAAHKRRLDRWGDPLGSRPAHPTKCVISDCDESFHSRNLCKRHYEREGAKRRRGEASLLDDLPRFT